MPAVSEYLEMLIMLAVLLTGFTAMAVFRQSQALVMPLVASAFLIMAGVNAPGVIEQSAREFAHVALVFSAVAIPAHQVERSGLFALVGARLAATVGRLSLRWPRLRTWAFVTLTLVSVWASAGVLHNITAVLIWTPITVVICASFGLPSRWLLCGVLVASNLGGFSTGWGDTPNIIESRVWGLTNLDFFREILPINATMVVLLSLVVTWLMRRDMPPGLRDDVATARTTATWGVQEITLDRRRLIVGLVALLGFIGLQFVRRDLEVAAAAGAVMFALLAERSDDRLPALHALGLEVYVTLASVFVIADTIAHAALGEMLHGMIASTNGAVWAIAVSSYLGTGLTEAASWAAAAAPVTHQINPHHVGAWALGAGICAGSSSVLTAASAGIVIWNESRRFPGHEVTFRSYLVFGLVGSLTMLALYIAILTAFETIGAL